MYNGIGLQTARGTGTNGYVQRNTAMVRHRKEKVEYKTEADMAKAEAQLCREPNEEILDHERKRKIELDCMEMQELMELNGDDPATIQANLKGMRKTLIAKYLSEKPRIEKDEAGRPILGGTHQIAAASQDRNRKLRDAFGISKEYLDGSSMDPLRKEKELERKNAKMEAIGKEKKYGLIKDPEEEASSTKNLKSGSLKKIIGSPDRRSGKRKGDEDSHLEKSLKSGKTGKKDADARDGSEEGEVRDRVRAREPVMRKESKKEEKPSKKRRRSPSSSSSSSSSDSSSSTPRKRRNSSDRKKVERKKSKVRRNRKRDSSSSSENPSPWKPNREVHRGRPSPLRDPETTYADRLGTNRKRSQSREKRRHSPPSPPKRRNRRRDSSSEDGELRNSRSRQRRSRT